MSHKSEAVQHLNIVQRIITLVKSTAAELVFGLLNGVVSDYLLCTKPALLRKIRNAGSFVEYNTRFTSTISLQIRVKLYLPYDFRWYFIERNIMRRFSAPCFVYCFGDHVTSINNIESEKYGINIPDIFFII